MIFAIRAFAAPGGSPPGDDPEAPPFSPTAVEETGAIDQMLTKVAEAYEREVEDTVDALTSILEPMLMVFLGVIIGVIVIALYLPLFMLPHLIPEE